MSIRHDSKAGSEAGAWFLSALMLMLAGVVRADAPTYTYDANGRLLVADYGGGRTYTFTYDKAGNILTETVASAGPTVALQVAISPTGGGSVTGEGLDCPTLCSVPIPQNQPATLTAAPLSGFQFLGWGGDASGTANPLTLTMNAAKNVVAYFGSTGGSTDTDGVADLVEMGPGGNDPAYDGDGNGIPDFQDAGAVSLPSGAGGAYVTLAVPSGQTLANVRSVGNTSPADAPLGVAFPYGFFEFEVDGVPLGGCTTVTLYLPPAPDLNTYYKYGATPESQTSHWYAFMHDGTCGAQIFHEATRTRVALQFCDGSRGDDDLAANGTIVDQGGPGVGADGGVEAIPTLGELGRLVFLLLVVLIGADVLRRRLVRA